MQISALNMIIAAQQARQATAQSTLANKGPDAKSAVASQRPAEFEPLMRNAGDTPAALKPAQNTALPDAPLGSQVDIRI